MNYFLPPLENTDGFELKEKPNYQDKDYLCPVCKGYGGWNLRLDAYGPGVHFRCCCSQCNGWGWVSHKDLCLHEFAELSPSEARERGINHYGMCYHVYECKICGHIKSVDSSG